METKQNRKKHDMGKLAYGRFRVAGLKMETIIFTVLLRREVLKFWHQVKSVMIHNCPPQDSRDRKQKITRVTAELCLNCS